MNTGPAKGRVRLGIAANVQVHQHDCSAIESNDTWVDNINYIDGYRLDSSFIEMQSSSNPGYIQINVWR